MEKEPCSSIFHLPFTIRMLFQPSCQGSGGRFGEAGSAFAALVSDAEAGATYRISYN